jgi:hypothetical protein
MAQAYFGNSLITMLSTDSSPRSGLAIPWSAIDFALNRECTVSLYVNEINLDILALDIHDGESLLPVSRSLGV